MAIAQCPSDGTDVFLSTAITITPAMSPCSFTAEEVISSTDIIIQDGASMTINFTGAGFTDLFDQNPGSITLQSDEIGGDGGQLIIIGGNFSTDNASISIQAEALFDVSGNVKIGLFGSGDATSLDLEGTLTVGGELTLNDNSSISGEGAINTTDITDNGTNSTGYTGPINCGGTCDPLPVEFLFFGAELNYTSVKLEWKTASETNNEGFEVQRSYDGISFQTIDFIDGHGTTTAQQHYQYFDHAFNGNIAYYRLKQLDYDESYTYSKVTSVVLNQGNKEILLYPSNVTSHINLNGGKESSLYTMSLFDMSGRVYLQLNNTTSIEDIEDHLNSIVKDLPQSVYILNIYSAEQRATLKFIKI